ncbi:hypothetical protein [Desulfopila inferna]|uniref:hypothetical protein n=1 Tax=Desulfopila inferna TaxID=468528 RepID=UPI001963B2F6|nr:hypothetical protein [Desulfopila inferna]MBM9605943.1 hypothetical protein [Desulfopila inferna]
MAHQSFAKTVLDTLRKEALVRDGDVTVTDLSCALHLQTRKDHKRMLNTLSDLVKSGKAVRVRQGVYTFSAEAREPDKREVMWRALRMRRIVTIADLQEFAGVSHEYAKQWLAMLVKRKIAQRNTPANKNHPHSWRLIKNDLVDMPVDTDKAAKLRTLRLKQKQGVISALDTIDNELSKVRNFIANMEDER